jgi:putative nucleotidyltransferase with HDIG domain
MLLKGRNCNAFMNKTLEEWVGNMLEEKKTIINCSVGTIATSDVIDTNSEITLIRRLVAGATIDLEELILISEELYYTVAKNDFIVKYLVELKEKDEYTFHHSINTAIYSMLIGKWLHLSRTDINNLILSGLLHDIGKMKISNEILNKPGKYTEDEYRIMKLHPIYGHEMLETVNNLDQDVRLAVLLHHERSDGSGYPYHFTQEKLNLSSKIVAFADVYDAMISDRVYRKKMTPFEAFAILLKSLSHQFDSKIVNTFIKKYPAYLIGATVCLSNGERGVIVHIPESDIASPIVMIGKKSIDFTICRTLKIINIE